MYSRFGSSRVSRPQPIVSAPRPAALAAVLACVVVLLACGATSVVSISTPSPTTSPTPSIALGPQPCEPNLAAVSWQSVVPSFNSTYQQIETVTCGDLRRDGHQEALVPVRNNGSGAILDFYIYAPGTSTGGTPTLVLSETGLYKGSVKISTVNTIVTGEVDANSCINRPITTNAGLIQDLFREWQWNGSALAQVAFPGIFPAFTRFQAEDFQHAAVDSGAAAWALDPVQEANQFAADVLSSSGASATLISSSGPTAQAKVAGFTVNLQRLLYPDHGMWEVTGVAAQDALNVTSPVPSAAVTSPITISGIGYTFEAGNYQTALWDKANLAVSDTNHCQLGTGTIHSGASSAPAAPFTGTLAYTPDSHTVEDGLLWVDELSAKGDGSFSSVMLLKLLIG